MDKFFAVRVDNDQIAIGLEKDGIPIPAVILSKQSAKKLLFWLSSNLQDMDMLTLPAELDEKPLDTPPNMN